MNIVREFEFRYRSSINLLLLQGVGKSEYMGQYPFHLETSGAEIKNEARPLDGARAVFDSVF